jgi:formylmethanofuran dehydrogenase subunit E-like metal-binding protein
MHPSVLNQTNRSGFVVIDSTGGVGVLSVYNCSEDIYEKIHDNTDIYVVDPVLRSVEVQVDGQDVRYLAVQVFEIHKMYVQDQRVTGVYSQSVAVN